MSAPRLGVALVVLGTVLSVRAQEPMAKAPSIVVTRAPVPKSKLVLVLDCSGSMGTLDVVTLGSRRRRFDVARVGVSHVATTLPPEVDLALVTYGHRVGYSKVGGNYEIVRKPGAPQALHPAEDAEVLVPFGKTRETLRESVSKLQPLGESPVYGALVHALKLCDAESTEPQRIVLITDSTNEISEPKRAVAEPEFASAWDESPKVQLDVILVGSGGLEPFRLQGTKGQKAMVLSLHGAWLADSIVGPDQPTGFAVVDDTRPLAVLPAGGKWTAKREDWKPGDPPLSLSVFLLRNPGFSFEFLARKDLIVSGGDAIQLQESEFEPVPRQRVFAVKRGVPHEQTQGENRIRFLRPEVFAGYDRFYLSVLGPIADEYWLSHSSRIEVRPLNDGQPASKSVLVYGQPLSGRDWPIPVLHCDVPESEWPEGADAAEIRAWVPWQNLARPKRTWALDDLLVGGRIEALTGVQVKRLNDVKQKDGREVQIELTATAGDVRDWELTMDPPPDRTRIVNETAEQATYAFVYDAPLSRGTKPEVRLRKSLNLDVLPPAVRTVPRPRKADTASAP